MRYLTVLLVVILSACGQNNTPAPAECKETTGDYTSCGGGYCSQTWQGNCSAPKNGVSCCYPANVTNPYGGIGKATPGFCWTIENSYCPIYFPFPCDGGCYATNMCGYSVTPYICHQ